MNTATLRRHRKARFLAASRCYDCGTVAPVALLGLFWWVPLLVVAIWRHW